MSGRIRSVKPEWLEDERLAFSSPNARVLSIGLLLLADDYGNGRANPAWLRGQVFPGHELVDDTRAALSELEKLRFVLLYESDGQSYFAIRNWDKHQKVDKPGKPRVPSPPTEPQPKTARTQRKKSREVPGDSPETLAKVPEGLAKGSEGPVNPPESLATDLDHDHDPELDQRPLPPTAPEPQQSGRIPCPSDLELTDGERSNLVIGLSVTDEFIDRATPVLRAKFTSGDPRTRAQWQRSLVSALTTEWSNPAKRDALLGKFPLSERRHKNDTGFDPFERVERLRREEEAAQS